MFVACDAIYMDIFKISPENWEHMHSIRLTDLTPTISRRVTCKTMMEVISSNRFMWLEDDGLCCTIWNLHEGSNVSYISSTKKTTFKSQTFRGHSKMAISPDESVVALARDGIVTTYYARTGIRISDRKFSDHQIEYVAFYGQSNQLFTITRHSVSLKLTSWILDPLQLESGIHAKKVPVPIIGRTVHAFFRGRTFENKGLVCEASGGKIHCYFSHGPTDKSIDRHDGNIVNSTGTSYPPRKIDHKTEGKEEKARQEAKEDAKEDERCEVRTASRRKLLRNGDGTTYWILYVEVVQKEKVIFSFVPEPWMRISASEIRKPEDLQKVYFLPGGKRFVVSGLQTLQIWSLPSNENSDPSLVFFWSRPRTRNDSWTDGMGYRSELVGEYYHCIRSVRIYHQGGEAEAEIKLVGGSRMDVVRIPGEQTIHTESTFLNCIRSIHLLSASYVYSSKMGEKQAKSDKSPFTSKEHAIAIARFTRGHINRQLPSESFYPSPPALLPPHRSNTLVPTQQPHLEAGSHTQAPILKTRQSSGVPLIESSSLVSLHSIEQADQRHSEMPVISPDPSTTALNHVANPKRAGILRTDSEVVTRSRTFVPDIARETLPTGFVTYVDKLGERLGPSRNHGKQVQDVVTVLTLLLDQKDLKEDNQAFLEGLLDTDRGEWVPQTDKALNPIKRAIILGYDRILETLIDYCVKNAKESHPAYLMPAVQCLNDLLIWYPDILSGLFMKASYIPAHNTKFVESHAVIANLHIVDWIVFLARFFSVGLIKGRWFSSAKYSDINDYKQPAFSLQSQLPFYSHVGISGFVNFLLSGRTKKLEERKKNREPTNMDRARKIYVSPFQFKPVKHGRHVEVFLSQIAGKDYFDSPAIEASLWFKWNKYGLYFWCIRFMAVVPYFVLVSAITAQQIRVSAVTSGQVPTEAELAARYLPEWRPAFYLTIAWGLALTSYEVFHMLFSTTYFSSLFNYIDLAAYLFPVIGCFLFLKDKPGVTDDTGIDGGPSQVWILAFGILLLYLNLVFELRIIKPLGIAVNTIINITKKIGWFLVLFIIFLVSFTHSLLYVLHTRRYRPCEGDSCNDIDYPSGYPTGFFQALATTYFFLSGRYDPVETSFEKGSVGFQLMMALFFIFTVILLLNVLIALMNDAFNESAKEGGIGYWKLVSEVIAEMEMLTVYNQGVSNHDSYPEYIYYCANDEEVNKFQSQFTISEASGLSPENRFVVEEIQTLEKDVAVEAVGRHRDHDELKQELTELRGLVKDLMKQLRKADEARA
ncbi:MAG: hypothetical protein J3Q66DRAFT_325773 [Benniella sp.]|nr:MAG: hypothetical protein J3Q66DRAFT_325773 [Benniella sp.]